MNMDAKEIKKEIKNIKNWLSDIERYSKLPDKEADYRHKQIKNAVEAIYSGYRRLLVLIEK